MPDMLTHYTFAKERMMDVPDEYKQVVYLGTQGPDMFLCYGDSKRYGKTRKMVKEVKKFGSKCHNDDIAYTYPVMFEYAKNSPYKDMLFCYLDGLFMHYCVDSACHPYVCTKAGWVFPETDPNIYVRGHSMVEYGIDIVYPTRHNTFTIHPYDVLDCKEEYVKEISKMWDYFNKNTYKDECINEDTYFQGKQDYYYRMREQNKNRLLSYLKGVVFADKLTSDYYTHYMKKPLRKTRKFDFLNDKKETWKCLWDGQEHSESFEELMDQAFEKYKVTHSLVLRAKEGEDVKEDLIKFTNNINHTGYYCDYDYSKAIVSSPLPPDGYDIFGNKVTKFRLKHCRLYKRS